MPFTMDWMDAGIRFGGYADGLTGWLSNRWRRQE